MMDIKKLKSVWIKEKYAIIYDFSKLPQKEPHDGAWGVWGSDLTSNKREKMIVASILYQTYDLKTNKSQYLSLFNT